jgi:hypothetical protein
MQVNNAGDLKTITNVIKSTAATEAERHFKSEKNTQERAAIVYLAVRARVTVALLDAGVDFNTLLNDIDPTESIVTIMLERGYPMMGDDNDPDAIEETLAEVFGPVKQGDCIAIDC